ncbi:MAG TPA: TraR/DksA C4-type zinc finger protein [Nevskiaceae bacterium]|nr:TraR/DksA C4-type zinc finger protein [Nevskiaceae bacterium]
MAKPGAHQRATTPVVHGKPKAAKRKVSMLTQQRAPRASTRSGKSPRPSRKAAPSATKKPAATLAKAARSSSQAPAHEGAARLVAVPSASPAPSAGGPPRAVRPSTLPAGYRPSESEPYMSPTQLAYFRAKLEASREDLETSLNATVAELQSESVDIGDDADRATVEHYHSVRIHEKSRQRNLLRLIDAALHRIDTGTYGYCAETGEPIGLARLEARPTAILSLDAQERREYGRRTAFGT